MDSTPQEIRKAVEGSLKRLQTDHIDLYYTHRVDPKVPIEAVADTMAKLHEEGKILNWGISEPNMETLRRANRVFPVAAIESEYNMMWREPEEEILPTLSELNIGLVPYRPLARGFLTDAVEGMFLEGAKNTRFDGNNLPANMVLKNKLVEIAAEKNITAAQFAAPSTTGSVVYMTTDISPEGLMAVYEALGWTPSGNVAVKLSTGEPPASNYLRPELIAELVQFVDGTIVECNTAYGGSRAETAMHYQVAEDHGFTAIADFKIQDEDGSMTLLVEGGSRLTENYVGVAFADYDSYLILSHFKGHAMAGFGGTIKNISIGLGSSEGKCWIHSGGTSLTSPWGGEQDAFLESMAEAGKTVSD